MVIDRDNCMLHAKIEERLNYGDKEFGKMEESLKAFRQEMKAIADSFANEARELRAFTMEMHSTYAKQLSDLMLIFNTTINGNSENGHIGHEERIRKNESDIRLFYRGIPIIASVVGIIVTVFTKIFWGRMNDVLIAIDNFNKAIHK